MKRILSLPLIGLILALLLGLNVSQAQRHFKVDVTGKGKPIIFIHGLYCSSDVWKETLEHYKGKYECHVLTVSGFGGTAPNLHDNFLEGVKQDIIQYVKDKNLKDPVLIGHSMGGFISFWAAASAPSMFEKVIAVDGVPYMAALQMPNATPESMKPMAENMRNMLSNLSPEQVAMNQQMFLTAMITDKQRIDQVKNIAMTCDNKTQGQVMYEMFTTDLRKLVAAIESPVLLLGAWIGYKDYGATKDNTTRAYQEQVKEIKSVKVEMNDSAKHFIFYDDPNWFFEKVDAFLK